MSYWGLEGAVAFGASQVIDNISITDIDNEYSVVVLDIPSGVNEINLPKGRENQLKFIYVNSANGIFRITGNIFNQSNLVYSNKGETGLLVFNDENWVPIEGSIPEIIPAFAQLSHTANIVPITTGETVVPLNSQDEIENISANANGTITIQHSGLYHFIFGGQMGRTGGGGSVRSLRMWIKKDDVDVPRTNVENSITNVDSQVLVLNYIGYLYAGQTIKAYVAVSDTNGAPGLYAHQPPVGPLVPAIIVSIFKVK